MYLGNGNHKITLTSGKELILNEEEMKEIGEYVLEDEEKVIRVSPLELKEQIDEAKERIRDVIALLENTSSYLSPR